ncbi:MAG: glycosyltransferase family 4 protein [Phycisphaerales bacterium]|nr:MAG: glycosyltransferase family 4 protein [Phycisphaerales bacterium]
MRIAYLVAGAGRMYCGACMRDNRVAATLVEQGRDVVVVPLYMPVRTDEIEVSHERVYYGGLNVYLQQKSALFRHTPWIVDRLLDSDTLLHGVGRLAARTRTTDLGQLTVSILAGEHGPQRKELDKLIAGLASIKPDVVNLPNLMFAGTARTLKDALHVPIVCTLPGEDVFLDSLAEPYRQQAHELICANVRYIDGFIAPTKYYAAHAVEKYGLNDKCMHMVPMGICVEDFVSSPASPEEPFTIGYLAAICPEKGLHVLCEAFELLREAGRDCRLRVAGYVGGVGREYWAGIRNHLQDKGLMRFVDFVGEVDRDEKLRFLRSLHVLSVPTVYPEAKGFFVLEAMASGVPVVQPGRGSFPELIEATGGGCLVDPGKPSAFAHAIAQLMDNETLRTKLAHAARVGVQESFTDKGMANETWSVYEQYHKTNLV